MTDEPTYFMIESDVETLDALYNFNDEDALHAPTSEQVQDALNDEGDRFSSLHFSVRATPEEITVWSAAYKKLTEEAERADAKLRQAEREWEQAQSRHSAALRDAYNDYAPVHQLIDARADEIDKLREQNYLAAQEKKRADAAAARAKEDAELGPRTWGIFHPNSLSISKVTPDSMVPVIHLATCSLIRNKLNTSYQATHVYARKDDVERTLLAGGPRLERGRSTTDTLFTKLCGRCKPEGSLEEALGDTYRNWRLRKESVQEPLPTPTTLAKQETLIKALGLTGQWNNRRAGTEGYCLVSDKYKRAENVIEPHELLIGWLIFKDDGDRTLLSESHEEKLEALIKELPARGFAARRHDQPLALRGGPGVLSKTSVAVRRMTAHEKRQFKADADATAAYRKAQA